MASAALSVEMLMKLLHAHLAGALEHVERAQHVRLPAFVGIPLKHGQVLQRCRMEYDVGPMRFKYPHQSLAVPNVAQRHIRRVEQRLAVDRELNRMQPGLITVEADEFLGTEPVHLASDLRPDRAASAGNENNLAAEVPGNRTQVGVNRVSSKHVEHIELVQLVQLDASADDVSHRRQHQQLQSGPVQVVGESFRKAEGADGIARITVRTSRLSASATRAGRSPSTRPKSKRRWRFVRSSSMRPTT